MSDLSQVTQNNYLKTVDFENTLKIFWRCFEDFLTMFGWFVFINELKWIVRKRRIQNMLVTDRSAVFLDYTLMTCITISWSVLDSSLSFMFWLTRNSGNNSLLADLWYGGEPTSKSRQRDTAFTYTSELAKDTASSLIIGLFVEGDSFVIEGFDPKVNNFVHISSDEWILRKHRNV